MINLLKADFFKLRKNIGFYVILGLSIIIPLFTQGVIYLALHLLIDEAGSTIPFPIDALYSYSSGFSPLSNLGLFTFLFVAIIAAGDFTQNTIRNKVIAGHKRSNIYFSTLIVNLTIITGMTLLSSTVGYIIAIIFDGFDPTMLISVLKYAAIGYSGLFVLYSLLTLFLFKQKTTFLPLLTTLGILILVFLVNQVVSSVAGITSNREGKIIYNIFPILRIVVTFGVDISDWWLATIINILHLGWIIPLGLYISKKTDFK